MKAVVFHEFGGVDVLVVEEVDDPRPGPGDVVVDITARDRPGHGRRHQLQDSGRRRGGHAGDRRSRGRRRLRARRGGELPVRPRLAQRRRPPRHVRRARRRGRPVRRHPLLPSAEERDRVVHLHPRGDDEVPRSRRPRPDQAPRPFDLPARPGTRRDVDVGGTFTDLIYVDDEAGKILGTRSPTTPGDPSRGTVQGVRELDRAGGRHARRRSTRSSTAPRSRRTS